MVTPKSGEPFTFGGLNWVPDIYPYWWTTLVPERGTVSLKFDVWRKQKKWTVVTEYRIGDFETLEEAVRAIMGSADG